MSRYNVDDDIKFVENQMANARAYKEEQADKADDFAKKLLGFDLVVARPLESLAKQRATESMQKGLESWGKYQSLNNSAEMYRTIEKERLDQGLTREQAYYEYLVDNATDYFNSNPATQGMDIRTGGYWNAAQAEIDRLSKDQDSFTKWNNAIEKSLSIPQFSSPEEWGKVYASYGGDLDKTPIQLGLEMVGGIFKKETPETLAAKEAKQKDFLINTQLGEQYKELGEALKDANGVFSLKEALDEIPLDGLQKIIPETIKSDIKERASGGFKIAIPTLTYAVVDVNGEIQQRYQQLNSQATMTPLDRKPPTAQQIKNEIGELFNFIDKAEGYPSKMVNELENKLKTQETQDMIAQNYFNIKENIKNYSRQGLISSLDDVTIAELAFNYVIDQANAPYITENITLLELYKSLRIDDPNLMMEAMPTIMKNLSKVAPNSMSFEAINFLKDIFEEPSNLDQKREYATDMLQILQQNDVENLDIVENKINQMLAEFEPKVETTTTTTTESNEFENVYGSAGYIPEKGNILNPRIREFFQNLDLQKRTDLIIVERHLTGRVRNESGYKEALERLEMTDKKAKELFLN